MGIPPPHQNLTMSSLGVEQIHKEQKKNLKGKHILKNKIQRQNNQS